VTGGGHPDSIDTGAGDDYINSDDGARDRLRCGPGNDSVFGDPDDILSGCEDILNASPARRGRR
jgi:hypothetical protein